MLRVRKWIHQVLRFSVSLHFTLERTTRTDLTSDHLIPTPISESKISKTKNENYKFLSDFRMDQCKSDRKYIHQKWSSTIAWIYDYKRSAVKERMNKNIFCTVLYVHMCLPSNKVNQMKNWCSVICLIRSIGMTHYNCCHTYTTVIKEEFHWVRSIYWAPSYQTVSTRSSTN